MAQLESTARSRELGEELRTHRERAGLRANELARALGWHPSKVSRMESGLQWPSEIDLAMILAYCHIDVDESERLRKIHHQNDTSIWYQRHDPGTVDRLFSLVRLENSAGRISDYEPIVIPGLLQTEAYARALFKDAMIKPQSLVDERIRIRMARQTMLNREIPPHMDFFVHENVLHSAPASDRGVLGEQLLRMALVSANAYCSVRVIPRTRCSQGAFGGSFRLMDFAGNRPVGFREQHTANLFFEGRQDIEYYRNELKKLSSLALDKQESRELLASVASVYE